MQQGQGGKRQRTVYASNPRREESLFTRKYGDSVRDFQVSFDTFGSHKNMRSVVVPHDNPVRADFCIECAGLGMRTFVDVYALPYMRNESCARVPVAHADRLAFPFRTDAAQDATVVALENPQSTHFYIVDKYRLQGFFTNHDVFTPVFKARDAMAPFTKLMHDRTSYVYVPWEMIRRIATFCVPLIMSKPLRYRRLPSPGVKPEEPKADAGEASEAEASEAEASDEEDVQGAGFTSEEDGLLG